MSDVSKDFSASVFRVRPCFVFGLGAFEHLIAFHKPCGVFLGDGTRIVLVLQCCLASLEPVNNLDGKQKFQNYCTHQVNLLLCNCIFTLLKCKVHYKKRQILRVTHHCFTERNETTEHLPNY